MEKQEPDFKAEDLQITEDCINQLIEQLNIEDFTNVDDITLENLKDFLIPVLESYQKGDFYLNTLKNISEWLKMYTLNYYKNSDDFSFFFEKNDSRFPGMYVLSMMDGYVDGIKQWFWMAPEDVPLTLEFLKAPIENQEEAYKKLWEYIKPIKWIERAVPCGGGHVPMDSLCGEDKIHIEIRRCLNE